MLLIWLLESWMSSMLWKLGCCMSFNRLRLNADKIQFIPLSTSHFLGERGIATVNSILLSTDGNNIRVYLDLGHEFVRWANSVRFAISTCVVVFRSLTKGSLLMLVHGYDKNFRFLIGSHLIILFYSLVEFTGIIGNPLLLKSFKNFQDVWDSV